MGRALVPSDGEISEVDVMERRPTVLVVDDQPFNIKTLYEILKADYDVCMATSGDQALLFCETRLPDLVLLDVMMPGMDGFELCRRLKAGPRTADIPLMFVTAQNQPSEEVRALDQGAADFISKPFHEKVVRARVRTQITLKRQADRLRSMALIDGLTGVANRRHFDRTLTEQWAHCIRSGTTLSVMMIDIDHFKKYNDTYGHLAGDTCIQAIATALKTRLRRPHDLVARYGGEEFGCIMPYVTPSAAHDKGLELERAVRELAIPHGQSTAAEIVTISLGIATVAPAVGREPHEAVAAADRELYAAKTAGRGRVRASYAGAAAP
jgi:diguanylate cyclase (GGDEF)-like protein